MWGEGLMESFEESAKLNKITVLNSNNTKTPGWYLEGLEDEW